MLEMKNYFQKKKGLVLFLGILFLIGIVVGILLASSHIDRIQSDFTLFSYQIENNSYNYILFHFFFLVLSLFLSFFGIGIPLLCAILFYEGISFGFLMSGFFLTFGIKGLFFSILFYFISKGFYLFFLFLFFFKCLEIARKMIGKYLYKTDPSIYLVKMLKASMVLIFLVIISDLFVSLLAGKILAIFHFLLN